jgi:flagellar protein FliS
MAQYHRTTVETASKLELVIMCYEKAIQSLHEAKALIEAKEFEKKGKKLQLALDIINELQASLNFEKGGQIARNLDAIYGYIVRRLLQGDIQKDLKVYDESIRLLGELKEAWDQIAGHQAEDEKALPMSATEKVTFSQMAV